MRNQEVPPEVSRVRGCTCSGGDMWHTADCGLFAMPAEQREAAIDEARQRIRDADAEASRQANAELAAAEEQWLADRARTVADKLNATVDSHLPDDMAFAWEKPPAVALTDDQIQQAIRDPRNRDQVAAVLRQESRINPSWLDDFIRAEQRRAGPVFDPAPRQYRG